MESFSTAVYNVFNEDRNDENNEYFISIDDNTIMQTEETEDFVFIPGN
jgi:hypothetical protein